MCNLSQGVLEIGAEQGFELGFGKGIEQGENETKRKMIINMNNEGISWNAISRISGVSIEAVEKVIAENSK